MKGSSPPARPGPRDIAWPKDISWPRDAAISRVPPLVRLLRLPSVLTVPGDALLGAAWAQEGRRPIVAARPALGGALLYLAGMALNDWADRERDAHERPGRPIPAGELAASTALAGAAILTGAALALAGAAGARRLRGALALAGVVWLYDLRAKDTPAGPWTMALARSLDVLLGADRRARQALPPAAVVGAHALLITLVSAHEAQGADRALARRALLGVAATTTAAAALILGVARRARARTLALACLALYAGAMGSAGVEALRAPDAARLQRLVGAGVLANMPLQAALLAARGRRALPAALALGWPLARRAARRAAVT